MPLPRREYDRTINAEIERLLYQVSVVRQEADGLLWGLSDEQFNWTPGAGQWSLGQCIDHLNAVNRALLQAFEAGIRHGRSAGILSDGPFTYGFFGRWMLRTIQPPIRRRFKAPKNFQPKPRLSVAQVTEEWTSTHERMADLLHDANGLDIAKIKVTSPINSLIKYSLGIGFWIQTAHDRRHLWQARQVRNNPAFPTA